MLSFIIVRIEFCRTVLCVSLSDVDDERFTWKRSLVLLFTMEGKRMGGGEAGTGAEVAGSLTPAALLCVFCNSRVRRTVDASRAARAEQFCNLSLLGQWKTPRVTGLLTKGFFLSGHALTTSSAPAFPRVL